MFTKAIIHVWTVAVCWFGRKKGLITTPQLTPVPMSPDRVEDPDEMMRMAVAESFNSGKVVIANRDKHGNITIKQIGG